MRISPDSPYTTNDFGQRIGLPLRDRIPPPRPSAHLLEGRYCRLERLEADRHTAALHRATAADPDERSWTYMNFGPFADAAAHSEWVAAAAAKSDPWFYAIVDERSGAASGVAAYLRIAPEAGSIEVGSIHYAPVLARTRAATEAMYLLMTHAFGLGYRRYEWKCDALNAPSRRAADRLGFFYEGTFRQAAVYKGRSRDTAWYAMTDTDWPEVRASLEAWLDLGNFDSNGSQKRALGSLRGSSVL